MELAQKHFPTLSKKHTLITLGSMLVLTVTTCLLTYSLTTSQTQYYATESSAAGLSSNSLWDNRYRVVTTLNGTHFPPTNRWCVDISWYDATNNKYYLADATNKQVDVVDAATNQLLYPIGIGDFTGEGGCANFDFSKMGPEGVLTDDMNQLWVGNGDSTIHVYDADSGKAIATVSTEG